MVMEREIKTREQILSIYKGQWVLIGNPKLDDALPSTSVVNSLMEGIPLISGVDKKALAAQVSKFRTEYKSIACIFTGKQGKKVCLDLKEQTISTT